MKPATTGTLEVAIGTTDSFNSNERSYPEDAVKVATAETSKFAEYMATALERRRADKARLLGRSK